MGFVPPHPSLSLIEEAAHRQAHEKAQMAQAQIDAAAMQVSAGQGASVQNGDATVVQADIPAELEHQIVMSIVERVIAMILSRRGLKAIESFEQVQFLAIYVKLSRATGRVAAGAR